MAAQKISLYNLAELKNTSDDVIPNYLNSLKFKQSNFLVDTKLGLGYICLAIGAAAFAWDYKLGFEDTKLATTVAVLAYTILNGALTFWISFVEKGIVYQGTAPNGEKISITSTTKKTDPTYRLSITITDPKSPKKTQTYNIAKPFSEFFDESGYFVATPFQEILATAVPIVGQRDPKRVKTESQKLLDTNPELLDAVLAAGST